MKKNKKIAMTIIAIAFMAKASITYGADITSTPTNVGNTIGSPADTTRENTVTDVDIDKNIGTNKNSIDKNSINETTNNAVGGTAGTTNNAVGGTAVGTTNNALGGTAVGTTNNAVGGTAAGTTNNAVGGTAAGTTNNAVGGTSVGTTNNAVGGTSVGTTNNAPGGTSVGTTSITPAGTVRIQNETVPSGAANIEMNNSKVSSEYSTFRGTLDKAQDTSNGRNISVINQFGQKVSFFVDDGTYLTGVNKFDLNDRLVVVYNPEQSSGSPDYQFKALAVLNDMEDSDVIVSSFNDEFVSNDNKYSLKIDNATPIVSADNEAYNGSFDDKHLLVFYNGSQSVSGSVSPRKIVVYNSDIQKPVMQTTISDAKNARSAESFQKSLTGAEIEKYNQASSNSDLVVNLKPVVLSDKYKTANGVTMVSLTDVARTMGLKINYNLDSKTVGIANEFSFLLGHPSVTIDGKTHLLKAAPVEVNGKIYVPIDFFSVALNKIVYEKDGNTVINDVK